MRTKKLILLVAVAALPAALTACRKSKITPTQSNSELSQAVAKVDDQVITVGDLQERINKQSPFIRARYTSIEKKKEFLDNIIRFEVMAREAERKGYDKDPEVIRTMKQQMISKFMQKEFDAKLKVEDVPDADVEKYYKEHNEEFNKPDEVRVSQIFTADEGKCKKARNEAKAAPKADQKAFRDLVEKYSEDAESKARGGDMTFVDKNSAALPKNFIDAAFALPDVGDVTDCLKSTKGWHVLKVTQKRPGFSRPMAEVKKQIQQRLFRDVRQKAMDDFVADMRKRTKVEVYDDKLGKVMIDTGMDRSGEGGPGAGGGGHHMENPAGSNKTPEERQQRRQEREERRAAQGGGPGAGPHGPAAPGAAGGPPAAPPAQK